jgi:hypothetical protein
MNIYFHISTPVMSANKDWCIGIESHAGGGKTSTITSPENQLFSDFYRLLSSEQIKLSLFGIFGNEHYKKNLQFTT